MVKWYAEDVFTDNHGKDYCLVICIKFDNDFNALHWQIYIARMIYKNNIFYKLIELSDEFNPKEKNKLYEFDCCDEIDPKFISYKKILKNKIMKEGLQENEEKKIKCKKIPTQAPTNQRADVRVSI